MKFKFCSDGDCPLWALAGLHALSSLPAPLFRTFLQHVVEEQPDDDLMDILKDTCLSSRDECARAAAVIRWVLRQCWRCGCSGTQLARDLLVLGVPRAHATAMAQVADSARDAYVANAETNGFMVKKLTDISASSAPEGTVDSVKLTLYSQNTFTGENEKKELLIEKNQAKTLLEQLKTARQKMENVNID